MHTRDKSVFRPRPRHARTKRWLAVLGFGFGIAFTPTVVRAVTLSGTIQYSGAHGPVSAARPILIYLWDAPSPQSEPLASAIVTTNGGAFALEVATAGAYYLAYALDVNND